MSEQSTDGLFHQEPKDVSRKYAALFAVTGASVAVLVWFDAADFAAKMSAAAFIAQAIALYTITGPDVVEWVDVE